MSDAETDQEVPEDERFDATICGVVIGTFSGWDIYGDNGVMFNDFEPNAKFREFFYGDVEPNTICIDLVDVSEGKFILGYLDETEVVYDWKEFFKLLIAE